MPWAHMCAGNQHQPASRVSPCPFLHPSSSKGERPTSCRRRRKGIWSKRKEETQVRISSLSTSPTRPNWKPLSLSLHPPPWRTVSPLLNHILQTRSLDRASARPLNGLRRRRPRKDASAERERETPASSRPLLSSVADQPCSRREGKSPKRERTRHFSPGCESGQNPPFNSSLFSFFVGKPSLKYTGERAGKKRRVGPPISG